MRRSVPLVATLVAEAGAVVLLYRFIREPGFAIPIGLGFAAWLLSSTLIYLLASLARIPAAIRVVGRVTLPTLRRRVDRAVAASILTGALVVGASPALAAPRPIAEPVVDASTAPVDPDESVTPDELEPVVEEAATKLPVRTGRVGDPAAITEVATAPELPLVGEKPALPAAPATSLPVEPKPTVAPPTTAPTTAPAAAPTGEPTPERSSDQSIDRAPSPAPFALPRPAAAIPNAAPAVVGSSYTVAVGDNFWDIAARHLADASGRKRAELTDDDILEYWVRVCDANRARIRSGDVNLIDPGEVVALPSV